MRLTVRGWETSFHFRYPYEADVALNTKMSVSRAEKRRDGGGRGDGVPPDPAGFMEEEEVREGGTSRGTAYHRAMELLPFSQITSEEEVTRLLNQYTEEGKLAKEARDMIWPPDIYRFSPPSWGKGCRPQAEAGKLYKEKQFVMGIPAREMGDWDSDELVLIQGIIDAWF